MRGDRRAAEDRTTCPARPRRQSQVMATPPNMAIGSLVKKSGLDCSST